MGRQTLQDITQIGDHVNAQLLAGRREAEQLCRGLTALITANEEPVTAADANLV